MVKSLNLIKPTYRKLPVLFIGVLALVTSGCSTINISNTAAKETARVKISISGSSAVRVIAPGASSVYISDNAGAYSVRVTPFTEARDNLDFLKNQVKENIFSGGGAVSPGAMQDLQNSLQDLENKIESGSAAGSCSGTAGFLSTVDVGLSWNSASGSFQASCGSDEGVNIFDMEDFLGQLGLPF